MKKLVFLFLIITSISACRVTEKQIVSDNSKSDTIAKPKIIQEGKIQKADMELHISRTEKSRDSNSSYEYFILNGSDLSYGEDRKGRNSDQSKPKKTIELSADKLQKIKDKINELGLNQNYEKVYDNKSNSGISVIYGYLFVFGDVKISIKHSGNDIEDNMLEKLWSLKSFIQKSIEN